MKQTNRFFRFSARPAGGALTLQRVERIESPATCGLFRFRHENAAPAMAAPPADKPPAGPGSSAVARITFRV